MPDALHLPLLHCAPTSPPNQLLLMNPPNFLLIISSPLSHPLSPPSHLTLQSPVPNPLSIPNLPYVSVSLINNAISKLKWSTAPGPDGIPATLIKSCPSLAFPISIIANRSFAEGSFIDQAKIAYIHPIFKKGSKSNVENYRPIASLSTIPKLIESLMASHLMDHLSHLIPPFQHGFVRRRSTTTNLTSFCQEAFSSIESGMQLDVLYIDLSKAFDKVDHILLIRKLRTLGLPDLIVNWIASFVSSWSYLVKLGDHRSSPFSPSSGVPQGTHLGPILFVLFTIDIPSSLSFAKILSYADDTKLFARISSLADCHSFQSDIDAFHSWCSSNGLHINLSKCGTISFSRSANPILASYTIQGAQLPRLDSIKDLGVTFCSSMDFSLHIEESCSRAFKLIGFIKRNSFILSKPESLILLYCSLVRSVLEFSSNVWNPHISRHSSRIESLQKNFTRFIYRRYLLPSPDSPIPSYEERCRSLSLDPLHLRRDISDALFIRNILLNSIDAPFLQSLIAFRCPPMHLRHFRPLSQSLHRSNYSMHAPIPRCTHTYNRCFFNSSSPDPISISRQSFITHCRNILSS